MAAYGIKGAALLESGIHTLAEWSDRMVKEYGEQIRPHLDALWQKAQEHLKTKLQDTDEPESASQIHQDTEGALGQDNSTQPKSREKGGIGDSVDSNNNPQRIDEPKAPAPVVKWNPKSTKIFGHIFLEHGQNRSAQRILDRARGKEHQIGQFLDDPIAAEFIQNFISTNNPKMGSYDLPLPKNLPARSALKDGKTLVKADMIRIVIRADGSLKASFPYNSNYPTSHSNNE